MHSRVYSDDVPCNNDFSYSMMGKGVRDGEMCFIWFCLTSYRPSIHLDELKIFIFVCFIATAAFSSSLFCIFLFDCTHLHSDGTSLRVRSYTFSYHQKKSSGIPTFLFRPTFASNAKSFASFQCNSYGNSILLKQRIHTSHIANSFNVLVSYDMRGKGCGKRIGLSQIKNEEIKQQPNALNTFIIAEYMWYEKVGLLYRI